MRIGVDLGGTKIEGRLYDDAGKELLRLRVPTPREQYPETVDRIGDVVEQLEREGKCTATVGVGIPGAVERATGLIKNANSTWLNGRALPKDMRARLNREVRLANDANCLAVSEAVDGAVAGYSVVFAVIVGTGCGGGVAIDSRAHDGPNGLAGEWGHSPLPLQSAAEYPGHVCYCGRRGCIETWLSGPGLEREYTLLTGRELSGAEINAAAEAGTDAAAVRVLDEWQDRLARSLAGVLHILDPDAVVIGGGLSHIKSTYKTLQQRVSQYTFGGPIATPFLPAAHGDASGVRGAAWLWPE